MTIGDMRYFFPLPSLDVATWTNAFIIFLAGMNNLFYLERAFLILGTLDNGSK